MGKLQTEAQSIRILLARLERISADSHWAHRASGLRGALLRVMENMENDGQIERRKVEQLVTTSYKILENAGKDLIR